MCLIKLAVKINKSTNIPIKYNEPTIIKLLLVHFYYLRTGIILKSPCHPLPISAPSSSSSPSLLPSLSLVASKSRWMSPPALRPPTHWTLVQQAFPPIHLCYPSYSHTQVLSSITVPPLKSRFQAPPSLSIISYLTYFRMPSPTILWPHGDLFHFIYSSPLISCFPSLSS